MELLSEGCLFRPGVSPAGTMQWAVLEELFVGHCLSRPGVSLAGIMQWAALEEAFVGHWRSAARTHVCLANFIFRSDSK